MTTLRVTIDIFSGRPNPSFELEGAEASEAIRRLKPAARLRKQDAGLPPEPTLGYRGLVVEQIEEPDRSLPRTLRIAHPTRRSRTSC